MRVTGLHVYPVKSLAGVARDSARLDARGLAGDRRWGIVDAAGEKVTAREERRLLGLSADPLPGGGVRLSDLIGAGSLVVEPPRAATPVPVDHRGQGMARPAGGTADEWVSTRVGRPLRLVWQDDESSRPVRTDRGGWPGDTNSLSDAAPILLTTQASLDRLNDWLVAGGSEAIDHNRFRPNVIVDGDAPFAEDDWHHVTIGSVPFRTTMICDRCVMTTIDLDTLTTSKEPIRTLARHRAWNGATWFGIRLTPVLPVRSDAVLTVGDPVTPSTRAPTSRS